MWKNPIMTFELAALVVAAIGSKSLSRSDPVYTAPPCSAPGDWTWMYNQQEKPPCLTASFLVGACITKGYTIPNLSTGFRYEPPSSVTANLCLCSWAVYNLYSACSLCQGQEASLMTWDVWTTNCSNFKSNDSPFPANVMPPNNTTIPYWASINPTTWIGQRWDEQEAHDYWSKNPHDIPPTWPQAQPTNDTNSTQDKSSHSSNNTGAIAGGVVGGVIILVGIITALFLYSRKQRKARYNRIPGVTAYDIPPTDPYPGDDLEPPAYSEALEGNRPSRRQNVTGLADNPSRRPQRKAGAPAAPSVPNTIRTKSTSLSGGVDQHSSDVMRTPPCLPSPDTRSRSRDRNQKERSSLAVSHTSTDERAGSAQD